MTELENGDLVLDNGVIIPAEKRTRCEVYSRVVGYLRPVAQWNLGKKAEWADRSVFDPSLGRKGKIVNIGAEQGISSEPVVQTGEVGGILPAIT
jgi:ribonucleoside-triphosphate reductase